jgi:adenosylhomocysteine nucleosidase
MATKILILAALPQEADALYPDLGNHSIMAHLPVRSIGDVRIATCGMGKVRAALAVGMLANPQTQLIAMTGTCGRIAPIAGDCFWISHAVQHDYGARHPKGFTAYRAGEWPLGTPGETAFAAMADPGLGLPSARIVSGDVFLACPETSVDLVQRHNAHLVDMEVAAIAQAATTLGVPWAAIKAMTDKGDGTGETDFSANLPEAARRAALLIEALVAIVQR